jgi:hypothetical protein
MLNIPPQYNRNIVVSGIKHHKPNKTTVWFSTTNITENPEKIHSTCCNENPEKIHSTCCNENPEKIHSTALNTINLIKPQYGFQQRT